MTLMNTTSGVRQTDELLSIGALAARTGVPASAIRYYEQIGIMPRPARVSGRRVYDASAVMSLSAIHCARDAGFTLRDIRALLPLRGSQEPLSARWRNLATRKINEIDTTITRLTAVRELIKGGLDCNCVSLDDCGMLRVQADPPSSHGAEQLLAPVNSWEYQPASLYRPCPRRGNSTTLR